MLGRIDKHQKDSLARKSKVSGEFKRRCHQICLNVEMKKGQRFEEKVSFFSNSNGWFYPLAFQTMYRQRMITKRINNLERYRIWGINFRNKNVSSS